MSRIRVIGMAAVILLALPQPGAGAEGAPPDREMLKMIEFLRQMEMIKEMEMLREMHRLEGSGALPPPPQKAAPAKKPEASK